MVHIGVTDLSDLKNNTLIFYDSGKEVALLNMKIFSVC